jgi:hypothetical protein
VHTDGVLETGIGHDSINIGQDHGDRQEYGGIVSGVGRRGRSAGERAGGLPERIKSSYQ